MSRRTLAALIEKQNSIYFGAEAVNRISFLREDDDFISSSVSHSSTRFLFFDDGNPLVKKRGDDKLVLLSNGDHQICGLESIQKGLHGNDEWKLIIDTWDHDNRDHDPELRATGKPVFLFLGIQDESVGLDLVKLRSDEDLDASTDEKYLDYQGRYQGIPFYAVDLTNSPQVKELVLKHIIEFSSVESGDLIFSHSRKHYFNLNPTQAALYSHAKMYFDWIQRNRFCPGCGWKVVPIHAGGKLKCTNEETTNSINDNQSNHEPDGKSDSGKTKPKFVCPVKSATVSNVSFPRTDAVVITAVTNTDRTKILLSLSKRHAYSKMYACTAGFMEPSETVEVAIKREIWEETGVVCSDIKIQNTQPWPFPGNLMIGCIAEVEFNGSNEVIHLGHDRELADAKWFDCEQIKQIVNKPQDEDDSEINPDGILVPGIESIAGHLIRLVVDPKSPNHYTKL